MLRGFSRLLASMVLTARKEGVLPLEVAFA
jgi:hypothetical protein